MESSLCEKPERHASRRLSDHLTFEGQKQKVHSLVDKIYSRENLKLAWERVRANRGAPMPGAVPIRAHRAWTVRTLWTSKRMGWSGGWLNWRLRSGRRLTDQRQSDECLYRRPTANSGRWASRACGIGSA